MQDSRVISIVDDDPSIRAATKSLIRSLGLNAQTFASAEDFLQSPFLADTACVISDVQMPGMSGIDLQQRLIRDNRHISIVFITAFPNDATERDALQAGAIGFLHKPFDSQALINCIRIALGNTF